MAKGGEPLLDDRTDAGQCDDVRETHVAHDGTSHEASTLVLTLQVSCDKDCETVRPRNSDILTPPPLHHYAHVETENEGYRNEIVVLLTILDNRFEYPATTTNHAQPNKTAKTSV